ncbi:glycosyltransferase [Candidatus Microgenomates bacterium]|nr:glycosyltransferase [Candidatus Microgenomates bacterium]
MKIALIVFTRNERKNSEKTFPSVSKKIVDAIYVIDGNSTDGTQEFYKKRRIKIFGQTHRGVGGAYESAFANTKEDALIFWHPDGNMSTEDIKLFVKLLREGKDFIVASRMIKGSFNEEDNQLFKPRKWFNIGLAIVCNFLWGRNGNHATDVVQGFRAITRKAWKKMKIKIPDAIAPDLEEIIRALKYNVQITEFPTKEGYRIHGNTSMTSFKTGRENLKILFREIFS